MDYLVMKTQTKWRALISLTQIMCTEIMSTQWTYLCKASIVDFLTLSDITNFTNEFENNSSHKRFHPRNKNPHNFVSIWVFFHNHLRIT